MSAPVLRGLRVGDDAADWESLGFTPVADVVHAGGVAIHLAGRGQGGGGITGWSVTGLSSDVLPVAPASPENGAAGLPHRNGVVAVDHVVAVTGDLDATMAALAVGGVQPRRVRAAPGGDVRQAFYVLGTALLELVGPVEGETSPRFWGITLVAADLDGLAGLLGDRLGTVRAAVQPGRRIATLRREAGLSAPLAFISPR